MRLRAMFSPADLDRNWFTESREAMSNRIKALMAKAKGTAKESEIFLNVEPQILLEQRQSELLKQEVEAICDLQTLDCTITYDPNLLSQRCLKIVELRNKLKQTRTELKNLETRFPVSLTIVDNIHYYENN